MASQALPQPVAAAGVRGARELDVRPLLARGEEPFDLIVRTVRELGSDEALHLIAPFEPAPLYGVLRSFGRTHHTERDGTVVHVWFYCENATGAAPQSPTLLELSGAEPNALTLAILEKLGELGPDAQLLVQCLQPPAHLAEKLALRGYAAHTEQRCDGDYLIHVAPVGTFAKR
ncbi:MAG: DUF2249 domain-containing protein [Candidatus Binatia bacterium]